MVSLVNSHTNATSKRRHLWEIDLRFALNPTPGWLAGVKALSRLASARESAGAAKNTTRSF